MNRLLSIKIFSFPALAFILVGSAHATVLMRDSFLTTEYTVDTDVVGQAGGSGFTGVWDSSDQFASSVRYDPRSTGLSYTDFESQGGSLEHYRNSGSAGEKVISYDLSFTPPEISGSDVAYFGFLFQAQDADSTFTVDWIGAGTSRTTSFSFNGSSMVVRGGGVAGDFIGVTADPGETHLLLMRISDNTTHQFSGHYDNLEVWVDPDLTNLGTADNDGVGIFSKFNGNDVELAADTLAISASLAPGEAFTVDEFFYTDDFNSIPIIPEPSSFALLGGIAAAIALMVRRWR